MAGSQTGLRIGGANFFEAGAAKRPIEELADPAYRAARARSDAVQVEPNELRSRLASPEILRSLRQGNEAGEREGSKALNASIFAELPPNEKR